MKHHRFRFRVLGGHISVVFQPPDATGYRHLTVWVYRRRGPAWLQLSASLHGKGNAPRP